ncbi:Raslike protein 1, putative [Acanthamoeba castellanii str. Neff]|uniref:small monomeric GTPase n=1 Tax=Acanthamoeba castellanii (strain ATCC 30010 / Neff) TaxID=1257118 RepID=L8HKN5_ACACF|nr:Raslike protein 1, putative [Acanthamoeba castellanii str. Neff]ELR25233.1 Raslike protein 1, putative [Acanthamoeba castellanii str. Neff]
MREYTLVVLGPGGVGKSAITVQFIHDKFLERYDPTVEDSYRKEIAVDGAACTLDIMDTAGQDEYKALMDQYMKNAHGFLMVYSITSTTSFEAMNKFHESIRRVHPTALPVLLVGNKVDLENDREIQRAEGEEWAKKHHTGFIEVSAKGKINVVETFEWMVRAIDEWRKKHPDLNTQRSAAVGKKKKCTLF